MSEPFPTTRSDERERVDRQRKGFLPRLAPEHYRGRAFVLWTLTLQHRAIGWLTPAFHQTWQFTLLHTCARYALACPVYVLMPDHAHLLWLGLEEAGSDQRVAVEFLRKVMRHHLAPAEWQHQPFDHVLTAEEREHGAFAATATYILDNPVRAEHVKQRGDWPYSGCCVPGYPNLDPHSAEYWPLFWRIYNRLVDATGSTRSRSSLQ